MRKTAEEIPVDLIDLGPENPRIRAAIERQGIQDPSEEDLSFHLSAAVSGFGSGGHGTDASENRSGQRDKPSNNASLLSDFAGPPILGPMFISLYVPGTHTLTDTVAELRR